MRVSTQFPIAVHALMMVAYFPETRITSDLAAESAGCNSVIIRNIFLKLKKAGLLSVRPGRGKMKLAKPISDITLWDIYSAVETDETDEIFKFHPNTSDTCPVGCNIRCLLLSHLDNAVAAMRAELSSVTLEDLTQELKTFPSTMEQGSSS
ncbi:transcriptional regulator, BadM/Rrf2 family [Anaerocolumna jejuensis DSM 15929]|uniref:Transcriptional regulator, BadM/Rrf2 family n=1 Tax=Anaerocolumna jejuensis DSM 15929 TaxID=1121322 RepID=A0A1M6PT27_9FIRM|nr:Rrf2 family transcriptional regulator [Anaerocolumna jejuensis]SHK11062.1 transcriptional regulator, BadM/Rrf2 family [Anaerocolumna jejuensis DSM 15929]